MDGGSARKMYSAPDGVAKIYIIYARRGARGGHRQCLERWTSYLETSSRSIPDHEPVGGTCCDKVVLVFRRVCTVGIGRDWLEYTSIRSLPFEVPTLSLISNL